MASICRLFWDVFTLRTAFVITYEQLVVMRFSVSLGATSCYVGLVHVVNSQVLMECLSWPLTNLLDSWYRKKEVDRRSALFWFANSLGQMIAGYLQAAAYTNPNNNHGGSFISPDMPERTKSRFRSGSEKAIAVFLLKDAASPNHKPIPDLFKRVLAS
ncbi:hypothetical protein BJX62DRAFT_244804 [Aspergillus germanicus]